MPLADMPFAFNEAERALDERLRKLAAEADQVEAYAQPHAERLARLAVAVGQRCGLHGPDLTALKFAALAHDLGERKLKRDYLRRPSRLNWEEQLDLWRHPILGEQEAQNLKLSREVQLLIRWHHEWWNGMGYPDGLAGTAIPLGARILRAVDTWCALTADRPYRGAYDNEVAEQKLIEQTGLECDPQVVKTLLAVLADERAKTEAQYATSIPESYETSIPESYETEQIEAVTRSVTESEPEPVPPSNVIEMPLRSPVPTEETTEESTRSGTVPPPLVSETQIPVLFDEPTPHIPSPVLFDEPTMRVPPPPTPPPSPLWQRFSQQELEHASSKEETAPLDDSPDVVTAAFPPAQEVPAVDNAPLAENRLRSNSLGLGSFLPEPAPVRSTPLTLVPSSKLQVIALSEVPDHFWLVAKWIYEEWWETPDNSISVVSNLLKEHLASTTLPQTFVALLDGQPVGSISLVENGLSERAEPITPWLNWLFVLPEHRRQGIGSRLLEGAFTRAKLQGAETLHLATQAALESFFIKHGWEVIEREVGPQRLSIMTRTS